MISGPISIGKTYMARSGLDINPSFEGVVQITEIHPQIHSMGYSKDIFRTKIINHVSGMSITNLFYRDELYSFFDPNDILKEILK